MAGRRQYGGGTVFKRADGRWIGRVEAGWTSTGTRRRITVTAATQAKAQAKLRAKQREIAQDGLSAVQPKAGTVKAWADHWLTLHVAEVKPKSYATDRSAVMTWIVPTIGHKRLDALTPGDVRAVLKSVRDAGRADATATRARAVLLAMLRRAREEGKTVPALVFDVKDRRPEDRAVKVREALDPGDAAKTLRAAGRSEGGVRFAVAMLEGLRPAEARGLRWSDIDLDAGVIVVSWQLQALPYIDPKDRSKGYRVPDQFEAVHLTHAYHLTRPKTRTGRRVVPLLPEVAEALTRWRDVAPANPWDLVFTTTTKRGVVMPVRDKLDVEQWRDLLAEAQVSRVYDLYEARHHVATLLLEAGVDEHVVTAIMGHTNVDTSRIYQTVTVGLRRAELARATAGLLAAARGESSAIEQ